MKEFKTESKKLLDLMINSIYTDQEVFLRELISNASDALDAARLKQTDIDSASLGIHISFDQQARTLTVSDTGIGMDKHELEKCLGTIAHSRSFEIKEKLESNTASAAVDLIGQFGVGFYSSFMVSDQVSVVSRAQKSDSAWLWLSNGIDGYTICPSKRDCPGTDVIMHIRPSTIDNNFERYLDQTSLIQLIKKYSNYIRYPITMDLAEENYEEDGTLVRDESRLTRGIINSMTPLWTLDEKDVSPEDSNELYKLEFRDTSEPMHSLSIHVRGAITYDAMLFIPQKPPAELYSKDYRYGLKLYSAGVLIDENCSALIPGYFRFVRGIVDTSNINLNVSREMIQNDSRIQIISRQIERSIIDSLKDMIKSDRSKYEKVFRAFGTGLKFAICTSRGDLSEILNDLLLYHSAKKHSLITLQEYLDESKDSKHPEVFYAVGHDVARLEKSPSVSAVINSGHDVLICANGAQDELCFMFMGSYKGASFHSVASANLKLEKTKDSKDTPPQTDQECTAVLQALFDHTTAQIAKITASPYLNEPNTSAARIATEGIVTISMAKYLSAKSEKDQSLKPRYILEVNTHHSLFALAKNAYRQDDDKKIQQCATVLVGQAFLSEDIPLPDSADFNEAINSLLSLIEGADAEKF